MPLTSRSPIVWRLSLASPSENVFELLDSDQGRERFWAERSRATESGFELAFRGGIETHVEVLEREPPRLLRISYFGSDSTLALEPRGDGGTLLQVTCRCDDAEAWTDFYAGWVSWLLVFKAAADFDVDLRNGAADRTWSQRYVDQ